MRSVDPAPLRSALADATDASRRLREALDLLFWAGEGIGEAKGAAIARGVMTSQATLDELTDHLETAKRAAALVE